MPEYRRLRIPGGTYFFTVNLQDRNGDLLTRHVDLLRSSVRRIRKLMPFYIDAWVVLPDHMHAIWTLPKNDTNFPGRWQAIKMSFSKGLSPVEPVPSKRQDRGERGIWQRRYWEHAIRDEQDYSAHMDYVHFNPVKHGLVAATAEWPYSSFQRCVAAGLYPQSWVGTSDDQRMWGDRPDL